MKKIEKKMLKELVRALEEMKHTSNVTLQMECEYGEAWSEFRDRMWNQ